MQDPNHKPLQCLVVDDEPMARDVIRRYIVQVPVLQIVEEFGNAIDAAIYLQQNNVDLVFLDIQMPQLTGTDFVRSLRNAPKIIFTTAFKEYAHEGFELDVVDYLLKPIRFDRFLRAISKAFPHQDKLVEYNHSIVSPVSKSDASFIYLRADRKMIKVLLDDILYIESDKDYVKIFTLQSTVITRQTITSIEAMLPERRFQRIHRSFIVSLNKIKSFSQESVEIGKKELPIGKIYRNGFLKLQEG